MEAFQDAVACSGRHDTQPTDCRSAGSLSVRRHHVKGYDQALSGLVFVCSSFLHVFMDAATISL